MGNDEYIRIFLRKHHYDGNIIVQTRYGNTWDHVESIICNEKDIPSKKSISMDDIQYDVLSEFPEDLFYQWLKYCKDNGEISYKKWITESPNSTYNPSELDTSGIENFKKEIEDSIDNMFGDFEKKYGSPDLYDEDSDEDSDEDFDEDFDDEE